MPTVVMMTVSRHQAVSAQLLAFLQSYSLSSNLSNFSSAHRPTIVLGTGPVGAGGLLKIASIKPTATPASEYPMRLILSGYPVRSH